MIPNIYFLLMQGFRVNVNSLKMEKCIDANIIGTRTIYVWEIEIKNEEHNVIQNCFPNIEDFNNLHTIFFCDNTGTKCMLPFAFLESSNPIDTYTFQVKFASFVPYQYV